VEIVEQIEMARIHEATDTGNAIAISGAKNIAQMIDSKVRHYFSTML